MYGTSRGDGEVKRYVPKNLLYEGLYIVDEKIKLDKSGMQTTVWENSTEAGKMPPVTYPEYLEQCKCKPEAVPQTQIIKRCKRRDFVTESSHRDDIPNDRIYKEILQENPRIEGDQKFEKLKMVFAGQPEASYEQRPMENNFGSRDMSYFDPDRRVFSFEPPSIFARRLQTWSSL